MTIGRDGTGCCCGAGAGGATCGADDVGMGACCPRAAGGATRGDERGGATYSDLRWTGGPTRFNADIGSAAVFAADVFDGALAAATVDPDAAGAAGVATSGVATRVVTGPATGDVMDAALAIACTIEIGGSGSTAPPGTS